MAAGTKDFVSSGLKLTIRAKVASVAAKLLIFFGRLFKTTCQVYWYTRAKPKPCPGTRDHGGRIEIGAKVDKIGKREEATIQDQETGIGESQAHIAGRL